MIRRLFNRAFKFGARLDIYEVNALIDAGWNYRDRP